MLARPHRDCATERNVNRHKRKLTYQDFSGVPRHVYLTCGTFPAESSRELHVGLICYWPLPDNERMTATAEKLCVYFPEGTTFSFLPVAPGSPSLDSMLDWLDGKATSEPTKGR
jgi:hypothetical protein